MIHWLFDRLFRRGFHSRRGKLYLQEMDSLARSGAAAWLLAQERARLEYLAAKEVYCVTGTWAAFRRMQERLLKLSSTNALVQSLLNEQALERRLTEARPSSAPAEPTPRRCA